MKYRMHIATTQKSICNALKNREINSKTQAHELNDSHIKICKNQE